MSLEFRILGPLEVVESGVARPLGGPKQRAVLAILLLHRGELLSSERLIDQLWTERPPAGAAQTLRSYISRLRKALGEGVLITRGRGYELSLAAGRFDVDAFEELASEGGEALAAGDAASAEALLCAALGVWRGAPLADFNYEPFALAEIARLEEARLGVLEARIDADLALGRHEQAVTELERLVREHPLRERLRAQRMLALYGSGRQAEALESYQQARRMLVEELGIEPGPELRELERRVLAQDPELAPPEQAPDRRRQTNLPVPPAQLVGRENELGKLLELARSARLLTLTGPSGVGKTRLGMRLAAELRNQYPDGVWWVSLESVSDPALVELSIAETVGARGRLAEHLAGKRVLIVLDNFEQLLQAAPDVAQLLASAPGLSVIATSRQRLALSAEQEYPVPPLAESASVSLFSDRARRVQPDFEPDAAVPEVCRRLDGLPLAIELAAARVKVMSARQLLVRLERRLDVLTGGPRDAPERQRTMRAAIDWSYQLLGANERRLLRGLAVFVGTFELEAAEAVCNADLDTLQSLAEKALVSRASEGRFRLLGTIGEYALERLHQSGETGPLRRRHAEWFCKLGTAVPTSPRSDEQRAWLRRLRAETDNLRAVLAWALEHDIPRGIELAQSLLQPWMMRGNATELLRWFERAFADPNPLSPQVRALGLETFGRTLFFHQHYERAAEMLQESLAVSRKLGDRPGQARVLNALGGVYWASGASEESIRLREQALAIYRQLGDRAGVARSLHLLAEDLRDGGDFARATAMLEQAAGISTEIGDLHMASNSLHSLADVALDEGDPQRAGERYREALTIAAQLEDEWLQAYCIAGLACVAALSGKRDRAARLWGVAESVEDRFSLRMLSIERTRYEQLLAPLIGDPSLARRVDAGQASSLAETVVALIGS